MEVRLLSQKVGFSLANFCQVGFCSTKEMLEKWWGGGSEGALPQMFCFKFTNNFQSMYHKGLY